MSGNAEEYRDVTADKDDHMAQETKTTTHNASAQEHVLRSNDPALELSHEHNHSHLHHSAKAVDDKGVAYSKGTTDEPSNVPRPDKMDGELHHRHVGEKADYGVRDTEAGDLSGSEEEDPRSHRLANLYRKFKPFIHLFIFLLFTG